MVPRRCRHQGRAHRRGCAAACRHGQADVRCEGPGGGAGLHRHPHARSPPHLRAADGRQLRPPGSHDAHRGTRWQLGAADRRLPRQGGGAAARRQLRDLLRPGYGARGCPRRRRPQADARRNGQDARARAHRHARRRPRHEQRPLLRAGRVHPHRRGHGTREDRRRIRRHLHLTHARRSRQDRRQRQARRSRSARTAGCRARSPTTRSSARRAPIAARRRSRSWPRPAPAVWT